MDATHTHTHTHARTHARTNAADLLHFSRQHRSKWCRLEKKQMKQTKQMKQKESRKRPNTQHRDGQCCRKRNEHTFFASTHLTEDGALKHNLAAPTLVIVLILVTSAIIVTPHSPAAPLQNLSRERERECVCVCE